MSRREPDLEPVIGVVPRGYRRALLALTAVGAMCLAGLVILGVFVYQQQQYIEGKGEQRDRESAELEERIDAAICDLLESLPASALLDRVRGQYGCGPGRPLEEFPPEVQREITGNRGPAAPEPPSQTSEPPPVGMGGAVPNPPRSTPYVPAPGETPAPPEESQEPDPVVDLTPVTESVDDLLCPLVCL